LKEAQHNTDYQIGSDLPIPQRNYQAKYQRIKCSTELDVEAAQFHLFWIQPAKYCHEVKPKSDGFTLEIYEIRIDERENKLSQEQSQLQLEISRNQVHN
jgi:hypothetical protein